MAQGTGNNPDRPGTTTATPTPPAGQFNPSAAVPTGTASAPTTDVYGLTKDQEAWTFYLGETGSVAPPALAKHLPVEDRPKEGSDHETALDIMKKFAAMGSSTDPKERATFANLQQQLLAIGAYGTSGNSNLVRFGTWTDLDAQALLSTFRSYQQVAGKDGAGQPLTFEEYVDQAAGQSAANGQAGGSGSKAPTQVQLTDPNQLRQSAQSAAQAALGYGLSGDQLAKFVDSFHQAQTAYQTSPSGSVVAPDQQADAQAFAEQSNPQQFENQQAASYMSVILNQLLPSESKRPVMAPSTSI